MSRFHPNLGPYPYFEVLSALRKTIKLADKESAIYWANICLEFYKGGDPAKMVAKQLWIMAAEDIDEPSIVLRAFAVWQMAGTAGETDHIFFLAAQMCDQMAKQRGKERLTKEQLVMALVQAMCDARKFWEHPGGVEVDGLWSKAIGDLARGLEDPKELKPIPEVALDQHTARGKAMAKRTGEMRDELSGTDKGRMKTLTQFLATGKLDYDYRVHDDDPVFRKLYAEQQELQNRGNPFKKSIRTPTDELAAPENAPKLFDDSDVDTDVRVAGGRVPRDVRQQRPNSPTQVCEF